MGFHQQTTLGRTGFRVGRLGVGSGYHAPAAAIEEAFERGCNYFTWGTVIKGFSPGMREALRNIAGKGERDRLVLAMFSYAHWNFLTERFLMKGLRAARTDYADVLVLGYFPRPPSERLLEGALKLREKGLVRAIGVSGHHRRMFAALAGDERIGVLHLRYNAVHRGAETDVFPFLPDGGRPGTVGFTATAWGKLLRAKGMPPGEAPPTAAECYRFALSHPAVDVCMTGPRTLEEMRRNLAVLDQGPMTGEELDRMRRIGDHLYGRR